MNKEQIAEIFKAVESILSVNSDGTATVNVSELHTIEKNAAVLLPENGFAKEIFAEVDKLLSVNSDGEATLNVSELFAVEKKFELEPGDLLEEEAKELQVSFEAEEVFEKILSLDNIEDRFAEVDKIHDIAVAREVLKLFDTVDGPHQQNALDARINAAKKHHAKEACGSHPKKREQNVR